MQAQLTFVRHNPQQRIAKSGPNAGNPFTVHEFFTVDNVKFDTTKTDVANAAYALSFQGGAPTNQPLLVTYDEVQNGEWLNRKITAVQAVGAAGAMPTGVVPSGTSTEGAPTGAPSASASTSTAAPTTGSSGRDDAAPRIARAVAYEHLPRYIETGGITFNTVDELFDLLGSFSKWIFNGSRPQAAVGADSSGAGGGDAGAAPAAPAVADTPQPEASAAVDDIPF